MPRAYTACRSGCALLPSVHVELKKRKIIKKRGSRESFDETILGYVLLAPVLLGITRVEAAVMGAVLGAVSPAVVVPRMVSLMEQKYGTKKAIHTV